MDAPGITLSVLIVSWNVRDLLGQCLESLGAQAVVARGECEVFVIDNASADGSVELVREQFPNVQVITNPINAGFGAANNQAFRQAKGRYVLLLNPDTLVHAGALDNLLAIMESQPRTAVLGCRVLNADGTYQLHSSGCQPTLLNVACHFLFPGRAFPRMLRPPSLYARDEPAAGPVGWVSGACMLLRREALGTTIFDERFFLYCEDVDLCARMKAEGWAVAYTPLAEVVHYDGQSFANADPETWLLKVRNLRTLFFLKHGRISRLVFDLVVAAGFASRVIVLSASLATSPSDNTKIRLARTRAYFREAILALRSGGAA